MTDDSQLNNQKELELAIAHLEQQRPILGNDVVDLALKPLYKKLQQLKRQKSDGDPSGQRRVVTVLFCDVVGSTKLAEGMDPEAWTEIMNGAFDYLIEPVERYDGTVARLMGDAILAFFGAPLAHEDDPQRAVLAGLAIINGIANYREKLRVERGLDFNVRVGINTGLAIVGDVGSKSAVEYTAMGDAVNIAARMEQTAKAGTVQIAQDTYSLIAPLFEFKELGGISVKGKSEPVLAYQVLAPKSQPGPLRGLSGHGISSPLVGRQAEMVRAHNALSQLMDGQGGILLVQGEAGIGKSRLMAELHTQAVEDGSDAAIRWLEGHTLSFGRSISYWPFQEILRGFAGINEDDSEDEAWTKLEIPLHALFGGETGEILPYLASILLLDPPGKYGQHLQYLEGEALGRQVLRAARRFFQQLAQQMPLVLLFDDLHWMDASSASLLEHIMPLTAKTPLLICGLSRPDPQSASVSLQKIAAEAYPDRFYEIDLSPLSAGDSSHLIHNLLDVDNLPSHIRQKIIDKADGNPYFLEEIVRDLIDAGALVHDAASGRWRATAAAEQVQVPDNIQGLMMARIDRLDHSLKKVLRRAAVIGRSFLYRVISALLEDDQHLDQNLNELQNLQLIREKQRKPEVEYIFKHALAQEAAYDSILHQERKKLHARVAEIIERLMAERIEEFYGVLAYHFTAAEQWPKAQDYLFKAGDQAWRMAADAEALAHYQLVFVAVTRFRGGDWKPLDRARLDRKMGEALYRLGRHNQARPYLENALALLGEGLPASKWGTRFSILRALLAQTLHRLLPRFFVQPMSGTVDPSAEEIYLASVALGWVEILANTERYLLLNLRALNSSERLGYAFGSATLAANMGLAAAFAGWPGLTLTYVRQAADYSKHIDPYRPVPQIELTIAAYYNGTSDPQAMEKHSHQAMSLAKEAGDLRAWGMAKVNLAWSYWSRAKYDQGIATCQELLLSAQESSDRQAEAWAWLALGCIQQRLGLFEQSIHSHRQSLNIAQDLPDWPTIAGVGGWMGQTLLAQGRWEEAVEHMESIEKEFLQEHGTLPGYVYLGNGLAQAYMIKAEASDHEQREQWLSQVPHRLKRAWKSTTIATGMKPAVLRFQGRYAWMQGKSKQAQKLWFRALPMAKDKELPWDEGMLHLEIGRYTKDSAHLKQAASILQEIGAEFDAAQAHQYLDNL